MSRKHDDSYDNNKDIVDDADGVDDDYNET